MRRMLYVILIFAILLCFGSIDVTLAETKDVSIELTQTTEGDMVLVSADLTKNDGVLILYLRVEYDESVLRLEGREFGSALSSLDPVDNFAYPYRVIYGGNATSSDLGRLFTLRFKVKEGASDGKSKVKLYVRELAYGSASAPVYNEKYGAPVSAESDGRVGGMAVAETSVVVSDGTPVPEKAGGNSLLIGLCCGGSVIFIGSIAAAYVIYRRRQKQSAEKQTENGNGKND